MKTILATGKNISLSRKNPTGRETAVFVAETPLSTLKSGDCGIVQRLEGGEAFRGKMLALGIIPGKTITVARGEKCQPYILRIDDCRVMMDWRTLGRIYVQPASNCRRREGWRWRNGSRI